MFRKTFESEDAGASSLWINLRRLPKIVRRRTNRRRCDQKPSCCELGSCKAKLQSRRESGCLFSLQASTSSRTSPVVFIRRRICSSREQHIDARVSFCILGADEIERWRTRKNAAARRRRLQRLAFSILAVGSSCP